MTTKSVYVVASKALGLYLLVWGALATVAKQAPYLPYLLEQWSAWSVTSPGRPSPFVIVLLLFGPTLLMVAGGVYLLRCAEPLATRLAGKEADGELAASWSEDALQRIGFSVVGLFLVAESLPQIAVIIAGVITSQDAAPADFGPLALPAAQLLLGLIILFGSRGLVVLVKKCWRTARRTRYPMSERGSGTPGDLQGAATFPARPPAPGREPRSGAEA